MIIVWERFDKGEEKQQRHANDINGCMYGGPPPKPINTKLINNPSKFNFIYRYNNDYEH